MPNQPLKTAIAFAGLLLGGCVAYTPEVINVGVTDADFHQRTLPTTGVPWTVESLITLASAHAIGLRQADAHLASAEAACMTAGAAPNPSLSLVPGVNTSASNAPSGMPAVSLDFIIETAGKRDLRLAKARQSLAVAAIAKEESRWQLRLKVRQAFREIGLAQARHEAQAQAYAAQNQLVERLHRQQGAGGISPAEVRPAELASQRAKLDLDDTLAAEIEAKHRLAEALGYPDAALNGILLNFSAPLAKLSDLPVDSRELRSAALARRADLATALTEYAIEETNVAIEVARQYPDIHLVPGYQWDQGDSKWQLGIGSELPLFNRNQGPIAEAAAHRKEAALRVVEIQERITAEGVRALDGLRQAMLAYADTQAIVDNFSAALTSVQRRRTAGAADASEETLALIDLANARVVNIDREAKLRHQAEVYETATHVTLPGEPAFQPNPLPRSP